MTARWVEWIDTSHANDVAVPGGRLVLLGGHRAIVKDDGSVATENAPAPEFLTALLAVPTHAGTRIVAHGVRGVYRFDDPLGAPVTLATPPGGITAVGAGPGLVSVTPHGKSVAMLLDVETGAEVKPPAAWPPLPVLGLAFRNLQEGLVSFAALGPAVTSDGGASLRPVSIADPSSPWPNVGVRTEGNDLIVFSLFTQSATVDPATGFATPRPRSAERPVATRLLGALPPDYVRDGLRADDDRRFAYVTGLGSAAVSRIDLESGKVVANAPFPPGASTSGPCALVRRSGRGLLVCSDAVALAFPLKGPLSIEAVAESHAPKFVAYRTGQTGGLLVHDFTGGDDPVLALQPSGRFEAVKLPSEVKANANEIGPLADGRVAYLASSPKTHFVVAAPGGASTDLPELDVVCGATLRTQCEQWVDGSTAHVQCDPGASGLRCEVSIDEGADGALHALVHAEGTEGVDSVRQPLGADGATITHVPATRAKLGGGHGVALGPNGVLVSHDMGETWSELPGTRDLPSAAPLSVAVGENGLRVGDWYRLGWGGSARRPSPLTSASAPPALLANRSEPRPGPALTCTSAGDGTLLDLVDRRAAPISGARGRHKVPSATFSLYDGEASSIEAFAKREDATAADQWIVRWREPMDPTGKTRQWSGPPPAGVGWDLPGSPPQFVAEGPGGRAFFTTRLERDAKGEYEVFDLEPHRPARAATVVDNMQVDKTAVRIGAEGAPIVWNDGFSLFVWPQDSDPRVFARHSPWTVSLGTPQAKSVPVLVLTDTGAAERDVPFDLKDGALPMTGWRAIDVASDALSSLPACSSSSRGTDYRVGTQSWLAPAPPKVSVDGQAIGARRGFYDVRIDAKGACLVGLEVAIAVKPENAKDPRELELVAVRLSPPEAHGIELDPSSQLVKTAKGFERRPGPPAHVRPLHCALR
ncbi:MAG: hypothetical protein ACLQVI_10670 [Polyangiaceae bacterium]